MRGGVIDLNSGDLKNREVSMHAKNKDMVEMEVVRFRCVKTVCDRRVAAVVHLVVP